MPNGYWFHPKFGVSPAFPPYGYRMPAAFGGGPPYGAPPAGPWFGRPPAWGGAFPGMYPRFGWGVPAHPSDEQIRKMIYDAIDADPLIPYDADINVEVTGGVVTLTGTVPNKRAKHAAGDDAWWVPGVWDVNNNLQIVGRREKPAPEQRA